MSVDDQDPFEAVGYDAVHDRFGEIEHELRGERHGADKSHVVG
jgi:hypothetical protein